MNRRFPFPTSAATFLAIALAFINPAAIVANTSSDSNPGYEPGNPPPAPMAPDQISFDRLPRENQIYTRDLETNTAIVPISGTVESGSFDRIILEVERNGAIFKTESKQLQFRSNRASFSFQPEINAELANYDFTIFLEQNGEREAVKQIRNVAAGDAFIFYGQSNAEARSYGGGSANDYASPWFRTFGQNGDSGANAENILDWVQAEGDGPAEGRGSIGQWAMVLGRGLVDTYGIPIAILNGSRGGYSMKQLQKDRSQPDNLYDDGEIKRTYNRLRFRAIEAEIAETARAIFFYQGEAEAGNAQLHKDGFARMRQDWETDYPGVEHYYIVQVRPGCQHSVTPESVALRDAQRRFADLYPNTSVMSTNGLANHDGCHFLFNGGYEDLGWHHFHQVARDLYGATDNPNIDSLNPLYAEFTDGSRQTIRLILRNHSATIHFPEGALSDFALNGSTGVFVGRTVKNNEILFHLAGSAPEDSVLEYRGFLGGGARITNDFGVGILSFSETVVPFDFLGLPFGGKESLWLGKMRDIRYNSSNNSWWLLHSEHGRLYTLEQEHLSGVWLWDHEQQAGFDTNAANYPILYRHNNGNGYLLYYGGKSKNPDQRHFFDYSRNSWITVP